MNSIIVAEVWLGNTLLAEFSHYLEAEARRLARLWCRNTQTYGFKIRCYPNLCEGDL